MYEDLVKRLNAYSAEHENHGGITAEAADAIEWLSMRLHGDEAAIAGMKREIEYMVRAEKPRWIPVGVRLPDVTFSGRDVDGFTENPDGTLSASSYFDIYESKDCLIVFKTPEELAEWIASVAQGGDGSCAPGCHACNGKTNCTEPWLEWLKQEAHD